VAWYSHLFKNFPHFFVIHMVKGFSVVNEAEVDVFLEFPCFFYDSMDVGNFISDSPAYSKPRFFIWKFLVHIPVVAVILLPGLSKHPLDTKTQLHPTACRLHSISPLITISLFSVSVSLFLFCKQVHYHFLESTYQWHHMIFLFLPLTYFT